MPNWCENNLSVTGEKNEVKRFYEKGLEKCLDNIEGEWRLFPYYPNDNQRDYGWCRKNWGTCSDIDLSNYPSIILEDGMFYVSFETAWRPPVKWLQKVQADYPTLNFELSYNVHKNI